jgi:hypothetical protein
VVPLFHGPTSVLVQYPAAHEDLQDAAAHLALHRLGIVRIHFVDGVEAYSARCIGHEYAWSDGDVHDVEIVDYQ